MVKCSRCDSELDLGARFCPACGAPAPEGAAQPAPAPAASGYEVGGGRPMEPGFRAPPPPEYGTEAGDTGPGFHAPPPPPPPRRTPVGRVVVVGALAVAVIAVTGLVGARTLMSGADEGDVQFVDSGHALGRIRLAEGVAGEPETAWEARLDGQPVAVAHDEHAVIVATYDGSDVEVTALDRGDGQERWSESYPSDLPDRSRIDLVINDAVVVTYRNAEGLRMVGLNRDSGEGLWEEEFGDDYGGLLALAGVGVFVQLVSEDENSAGEPRPRYELLRLDAATGETDRVVRGLPIVLAEGLAIAQDEDEVVARPVAGGDEVWQVDVGDPDALGFGYLDSLVLVADDDEVVASDLEGEEVWSEDASVGAIDRMFTFDTGQVLVRGEDTTSLLDDRGEVMWVFRGRVDPLACTGGGCLGYHYGDDEYEIVDLADGEMMGGFPASSYSDFALATGMLYVSDRAREVTAYSLPEVEELWSVEPDGESVGQVWAVDGGVLVATDEDRIFLLE